MQSVKAGSFTPGFNQSQKNINLSTVLKEIVTKVNNSALKTIYTYTGDDLHNPIYIEETVLLKKMIKESGITCKVIEVADKTFFPKNWDTHSSLLHIPGAKSSDLDKHLGDKIIDIKQYVESGGSIIGWCGGGYWLCHEVKYRVNENTTLEKIRQLNFWKGSQEGPLLPFLGNSEQTIEFFHGTVKIKWKGSDELQKYFPEGMNVNVLLSGGGFLKPAKEDHSYKVIAEYADYPLKSIAAAKTTVGKGNCIIVNPYFTYGADHLTPALSTYKKLFPEHPWDKIIEDLKINDLERMICFADMLLECTIPKQLQDLEFCQEVALNLNQAKPAPKQLNLNKLSNAGGFQSQWLTTKSKT